ncbi:hypothetical protein Csa_013886, partial [Cucumis sativus]
MTKLALIKWHRREMKTYSRDRLGVQHGIEGQTDMASCRCTLGLWRPFEFLYQKKG